MISPQARRSLMVSKSGMMLTRRLRLLARRHQADLLEQQRDLEQSLGPAVIEMT